MPSAKKLEPAKISKLLTMSINASSFVKIEAIYRLATMVPRAIRAFSVRVMEQISLKNLFAKGTLLAPMQLPISPQAASEMPRGTWNMNSIQRKQID